MPTTHDAGQRPAQVHDGSAPPPTFSPHAAVVEVELSVPAERVWSVLADGFTYPAWVVGASHMRAVDSGFPDRGSRLHHAVGMWPLLVRDTTEVEHVEPGRLLVLVAHGRPIGDARVRFDLHATPGGGCTLVMTEDAISTKARTLLPTQVRAAVIRARNRETLARLAALCERRTQP